MRTILILFLMCSVASGALVEEYKGGVLVSSYDTANTGGEITMAEGHDIYVDGVLQPNWNADTFMAHCMTTYLSGENGIHYPAVMRAVDRNTQAGWNLLYAYGVVNNLGTLASQIINDAASFGANIVEIE